MAENSVGILGRLAQTGGVSEPALRLFLSILLGKIFLIHALKACECSVFLLFRNTMRVNVSYVYNIPKVQRWIFYAFVLLSICLTNVNKLV